MARTEYSGWLPNSETAAGVFYTIFRQSFSFLSLMHALNDILLFFKFLEEFVDF